jgi:hypothetical protein
MLENTHIVMQPIPSLICMFRLWVFENRAMEIFRSKIKRVTAGRRKLLNEELHNLYSSTDIIRVIKSWSMG